MQLNHFLNNISKTPIQVSTIKRIEATYLVKIPEVISHICSACSDGIFFDSKQVIRLLSTEEIINASRELHVDFVKMHIIPIFDVGDNNFIIYDVLSKKWSKFNIVDEVKFKTTDNIFDLFE